MRMHNTRHFLLLTLIVGLLAGCASSTRQAPVVERNGSDAKPARSDEPAKEVDMRGMYTVKKGDTLIRIALEHGQNYRDLVTWNNLTNPNDIKVDQVLRVQPPEGGAPTVQTTPVAAPPPAETRPRPTPAPVIVKKSVPKGEKRPYSDAALAEMQGAAKPDASAKPDKPAEAPVVAAVTPAPAPAPVVVPLPTPPAPSAPDEEKISWIWPTDGKVVAGFDEGKNKGIDIGGKPGQQVLAAGAGKIMFAGAVRGYGNLVIVRHGGGFLSAYAHNRTILVKETQTVSKGQMIAEMGDSDTDSVKLHFEIRLQGKPVDPSKFLPTR